MIGTVPSGADAPRVLVTLTGPDLDLAVAEALYTRFRGLAAEDPQTVVVVDLTAVTFMDCAGLGPLVGAHARFGPRLLLRGAGPAVLRLLDLTSLDGLFHIETDDSRAGSRAS